MKTSRLLLASAVLGAALGNGCIITSAQVLTHFSLPNPVHIVSGTADHSELIPVDLTTLSDYNDHKEDLKGLTDLAILGKFTNVSGPAGGVNVYITPTLDSRLAALLQFLRVPCCSGARGRSVPRGTPVCSDGTSPPVCSTRPARTC